MPRKIQISRQGTIWLPHMQSYKMIVSAINAEGMPAEIFIKQRLKNFVQDKFDDNFVAVATPTQLEDFPINSPDAESSFYRVSTIELVGRLPENLDAVFDTLLYEVKKLVQDLDALDTLEEAKVYDIEGDFVDLIPGPVTPPLTSNKVRIGQGGYLETLIGTSWVPAAVSIYVNNFDSLPLVGNVNLLYITKDNNFIWRWDTETNAYLAISQSGGGGAVSSVAGRTGDVVLTKEDVGLANVDNTSDADKPVSTATQTALDAKADSGDIYNAAVTWTANHTLADGTRYLAGDLVYFEGNIYRAKFDNESEAITNTTYWENLGSGYRLNIDGRDIPNIPVSPTIQSALNLKADTVHNHTSSDISDFADAVAEVSPPANWNNLTDKPSEFPPGSHAASHAAAGSDPINIDASQISGLAAVATSNSYAELDDLPNIPVIPSDIGAAAASHIHEISDITGLQTALNEKQASGTYATLEDGRVPASQLPSYVDDVIEFANLTNFPTQGEQGKIYIALDTNKVYRWSGSTYIEISASPGSTDAVPEGSTNKYFTTQRAADAAPVQSVAGKVGAVTLAKGDVGLGNVDNTSDLNKPISTATQTALNGKQPTGNYALVSDIVRTYAVTFGSSGHNPAAGGQAYVISTIYDLAPTTSSTLREVKFPFNGVVTDVTFIVQVGGTLGVTSTPNASATIGWTNKNAGLNTNFLTDGVFFNASIVSTTITNLSMPIVANDPYVLVIQTPVFSTAPTTVRYSAILYIKRS